MSGYLIHALEELQRASDDFDAAEGEEAKAWHARHRLIVFGVAAITLDAAREDNQHRLPADFKNEQDEFFGLAYVIRSAPAHDIVMPKWSIKQKYRRSYVVMGATFDLSALDGQAFDFAHINGAQAFIDLARYGQGNGWV